MGRLHCLPKSAREVSRNFTVVDGTRAASLFLFMQYQCLMPMVWKLLLTLYGRNARN